MDKDQIWSIIDGIYKDIHFAKRALNLSKSVSKNFDKLPEEKKDMGRMIYDLTFSELILSLGRVYDEYKKNKNPKNTYPTRCLDRLYKEAKAHDCKLELDSFSEVKLYLEEFSFTNNHRELLFTSTEYEFRKRVLVNIKNLEVNEPLVNAINQLKYLRDKHVAHNEEVDRNIDALLTYEYSDLLIDHAEEVIRYFALAYCRVHGINVSSGKYSQTFLKYIKE